MCLKGDFEGLFQVGKGKESRTRRRGSRFSMCSCNKRTEGRRRRDNIVASLA